MTKAASRLEQELGRAVGLAEVAERMAVDENDLAEYHALGIQPLSLEMPLGDG